MRDLKLKVTLLLEDGSEASSMILADWSMDRELAEFQDAQFITRFATGQVTIRGVQTDGNEPE